MDLNIFHFNSRIIRPYQAVIELNNTNRNTLNHFAHGCLGCGAFTVHQCIIFCRLDTTVHPCVVDLINKCCLPDLQKSIEYIH